MLLLVKDAIEKSMSGQGSDGFKFGIEAEYLLARGDDFKPLWYRDLSFGFLNEIYESVSLDGIPSLDGLELLENLSTSGLFKNIPVIILSGYEDANKRKQCLDLGAFTYLVKPFEPQSLVTEVKRALSASKEKLFS